MVRCFHCNKKINLSETHCPYCGNRPWHMDEVEDFVIRDGVLLRYNGSEKDVCVPESVKIIGEAAFEDTKVRSIYLPYGVTAIEKWAFYGCHSLNGIDIPSTVTAIESEAFAECSHLNEVTVSSFCRVAPDAFPADVRVNRI